MFGTSGRNPIHGPGLNNTDLANQAHHLGPCGTPGTPRGEILFLRKVHRLPYGRGSERTSHVWEELQSRDREGVGAFDFPATDPAQSGLSRYALAPVCRRPSDSNSELH
jgi:hypothetical protein